MADMPRLDETPGAQRKASLLSAFERINELEERTDDAELSMGVIVFAVDSDEEGWHTTGWRATGLPYRWQIVAFLRMMADQIEVGES